MAETFLTLPSKEKLQILGAISKKEGIARTAQMLEKDIWICWALEHLFSMPDQLPMAFKGGTSLSKVFRAIERFSEDVDITIDYTAFNCGNPFEGNLSQSQLKKITEKIRPMVTEHMMKKCFMGKLPFLSTSWNKWESWKKRLIREPRSLRNRNRMPSTLQKHSDSFTIARQISTLGVQIFIYSVSYSTCNVLKHQKFLCLRLAIKKRLICPKCP